MRRRVATPDEIERAVKAHGPDGATRALARYGLIAPVAGASGLAIDASTPALVVSGTTSVNPLTTGSFAPPVGALLAIMYFNGGFTQWTMNKPTNTGGAVTWNSAASVSLFTQGSSAEIWLGTVTSSASMTVTVSINSGGSNAYYWGFGTAVVTGQAASPAGATATGSSAGGIPTCTIGSLTGSDSLVIATVGDNTNSSTNPSYGTNQTGTFNGHNYNDVSSAHGGWCQYNTQANLTAGSSVTMNVTTPNIQYAMVALEILAGAAGPAPSPNPQAVNWPQAMWRSAYR